MENIGSSELRSAFEPCNTARLSASARDILKMVTVPPQYQPVDTRNGFIDLIGPFYHSLTEDGEIIGMRVEAHHCNTLNIAHGGLLATFADFIVTRTASISRSPPVHAVTVSLNTDFIAAAPLGAWLEGRAHIGKIGGNLAFISCDVSSEGVLLLRGSGVVKLLSRPRNA
jgi:acyl-coenzyme A thioesterase 13